MSLLDPNLTVDPHQTAGDAARSWPGMAHFADTGPRGYLCVDCKWSTPPKGLTPPKVKCARYNQLMNLNKGPAFPAATRSCKYFEDKPRP